MHKLDKIYRLWVLLTACFMLLAGVTGGLAILYRAIGLEEENKRSTLSMLSLHFEKDYTKLAEEVYLQLGSLKLRQDFYQHLLENRGSVQVNLVQHSGGQTQPRKGPQSISWESASHSASTMSFPLYFGDKYLGHVESQVNWTKNKILGKGTVATLTFTAVFLAVLVGGWALVIFLLKRRVLVPLIHNTIRLKSSEATLQGAQLLTHDLKKPYEMLDLAVVNLQGATSVEDFQEKLGVFLKPVKLAAESVTAMLTELSDIHAPILLNTDKIALRALIENALLRFTATFQSRQIHVLLDVPDSIFLRLDQPKIERVLFNIFANAYDAMAGIGIVSIIAKQSRSEVVLSITNNGPEIPQNQIENIFEPFFTRNKSNGTGLGLAIARKYISAHGGRISCKSLAGQGVTFIMSLPNKAKRGGSTTLEESSWPLTSSTPRTYVEGNLGTIAPTWV